MRFTIILAMSMARSSVRDIMANMGKHRAKEVDVPVERSRLKRFYAEYCQPFYKRYRKFIVAALGAAIVALQSAYTDGNISQDEWWMIATSAAAAAGVWTVPNATNRKVIKNDASMQ